ncbi:unnamed protein product [Allacma fusca]|uniref:Ionotropic glutamate receptor C-terminal domain-containing protein n=1 Tax=Allacma fusca TaxID=39272 RepID=A0A8J2NPL2_9HEXA|nr:unnamed protein product [Allacma fusca]
MNIWIGLLIFAFIFWRLSRSTSTSFNSLFLVLSALVENCKLPEIFTRRPSVRVVVGIFFVFAMIVENSYKGKITASVTAPKPRKNLETFDDLQGFRIYSPISEKVQPYSHNRASWGIVLEMKRRALDTQKNQIQNQYVSSSGFSNLIHYRPLLTRFGMEIFVVLAYAVKVNSSAKYRDISQLHRILRMEAVPDGFPDVSIEEEVSKCNKSVFVDFDDQLDQFVPAFSKGTSSPFIKGKENFLQQRLGWTFQNENKCGGLLSRFIKRFLADSGIESWMEFKLPGLKKNSLRYFVEITRRRAKGEALSINSNLISSVLYISFCCVVLCWVSLSVEFFVYQRKRVKVDMPLSKRYSLNSIISVKPHPQSTASMH